MSEKLRLAVLFGGRSGEHEVSLMSARSVVSALDSEKYEIIQVGITKEGQWMYGLEALDAFEAGTYQELVPAGLSPQPHLSDLYRMEIGSVLEVIAPVDVVFPVLHGTFSEDGTIQGMLELADLPYVGAGVLASSVAMDKAVFKQVMVANGIPIAGWVLIDKTTIDHDLDSVLDRAETVGDYPLFTKPANLGSSVGISRCESRSDLVEGILQAAQYDRRIIVEKGLGAREIEVSVIGNEVVEASIPGEIIPGDSFYSYSAKYLDDDSELLIPAPLTKQQVAEAQRMAIEAYQAIDGAGMARVDFLMERETDRLFMNEINTIPGFTKISMYPKLWEASGLAYSDLLDRLIELALQRHAQKDQLVRSYGDDA